MKNYVKCLGIIALVVVIGLLSACGGEEGPEKTIKVTGVPAEYLKSTIWIDVSPRDKNPVAIGSGRISGNTVTFDLYTFDITIPHPGTGALQIPDGTIRFTETGTWNVHLNGLEKWFYADNTEIKKAVTTIPFSEFTMW